MKTLGGIILFIGFFAFFGAVLKGNSVFGPCFWMALGIYLLYRANNKEEKEETSSKPKIIESPTPTPVRNAPEIKESPKTVVAQEKSQENKEPETIGEIQSQMTLEQRETAMCMVALFGGYANKMPQEAMTFISSQAATFFGIPFNEAYISSMLARNSDSDMMIDTVVSIKSRKAKEFLLLTCHDLAANSSSDDASFLLDNIAADMGYDKLKLRQLVSAYR
ncbi:MAG: hypothetical protein K2L17_05640 [Muribaculaceae bacterium]|nr:hypothetical protein [Muribaculaceae bacterium]